LDGDWIEPAKEVVVEALSPLELAHIRADGLSTGLTTLEARLHEQQLRANAIKTRMVKLNARNK
jgi:hypothetical protein